jgi:two-component system NtrC family sensor kinase
VFSSGLRTKISINLALLLLLAMFSIDFILVIMTQRDLVRSEISRGSVFISAAEKQIVDFLEAGDDKSRIIDRELFNEMFADAGFSCAMILDGDSNSVYVYGQANAMRGALAILSRETIVSGKKSTRFVETTWGVFWKRPRYLIMSQPLFRKRNLTGGISIVLPLDGIYKSLRQTQYILLIYILANTVILTLLGLYRLSLSTVKPLNRLARRAGEYTDGDEMFFMQEREGSEYNKLSKALNNMLKNISEDKEKLRKTVLSLEKANLELKQAQKDIIRAEKLASIGRLSSGIAHEIGNPIGIIIGYLGLIKHDDIPDAERKEFIDRAESEINRINKIIRKLLDLSRTSSEGLESVSVHEIIEDIVDVFKVQSKMSDIDLELDLTAEKNIVMADPNQLRQVFLNLMINAADAIFSKADRGKGKLTISSSVSGDDVTDKNDDPGDPSAMVKIMFIDNGPGIPEDAINDIFDPFYTTKEPGKGTGLGLSVSFMLVEGIGGKIRAKNNEGEGTTMTVLLPLINDNPSRTTNG